MKTNRLPLAVLLLAFAASPAYAQTGDKDDKSGATARKGKPASTQFRPETAAERAQRQRSAEEAARAERFPPAPRSKPSVPASTK